MTRQYSDAVRDGWNNAYETGIGTAPVLELRTGAQPANCAAADSGTLLASLTLPSDWQGASSGGVSTKLGTWSGTAVAAGTAAHYRLKSSGGTCHEQGSVTITGGGGDLTLDNPSIANGQAVVIATWTRTAPGA